MKKVALGVLVAGFLIGASSAQAGTLEFTDSILMQNTNWGDEEPLTLEVSKYNRRERLTSIFVEVSSDAIGTYTLTSTRTRGNITYGTPSDDVGATVEVYGPSESIFLNPTPNKDIGSGTLGPRQSVTKDISGSDTKSILIEDSSLFHLFTGIGDVVFNASALSSITVTKLGSPFLEVADIQADARLKVIYTYEDAPEPPITEIPEPGTLAGLLAFGSLGLAANRRRAS